MHTIDLRQWQHRHSFLGRSHRRNERKAWLVMGLTVAMMVVELVAGSLYNSMALLADGWHMATHAGALGITAAAYAYARRHASNPLFTFGTGKFGDLAGFSSAMILGVICLILAYDSIGRLFSPVAISFDEAIAVACLGLAVNLVSAYLLKEREQDHEHDHGHADAHHRDHNLRSAHLHVLADSLTSVLAIVALVTGRAYGWVWMDPLMGVVGSLVIARWSCGLIRDTSKVLLDVEASPPLAKEIRRAIEESGEDRVADLHLWRVGPGHFAAIVSVVSDCPRPAAEFKKRLSRWKELAHVTIEVNPCPTHYG